MSFSSKFKTKKSAHGMSNTHEQVPKKSGHMPKKSGRSPVSVQRPVPSPPIVVEESLESEDFSMSPLEVQEFIARLDEDAIPAVDRTEAKIMFESLLISLYHAIFDGGHAVRAHNAQKVSEYFGINLINVREQVELLRNIRRN